MIAETGTAKLCKDCKHGMHEGGARYVCTRMQDIVTGHSPECARVRSEGCGPTGEWWARRMNTSAIVDAALITTYTTGSHAIETPMATIRKADDPSIMSKIKRPDDYKHSE